MPAENDTLDTSARARRTVDYTLIFRDTPAGIQAECAVQADCCRDDGIDACGWCFVVGFQTSHPNHLLATTGAVNQH